MSQGSTAHAGLEELDAATNFVRERLAGRQPSVGVVLGSGLGGWADTLTERVVVPYREIPNMPIAAVEGHAGNLVVGRSGDVELVCLQGRVHAYEGHELGKVVFGARMLAKLGCTAVLLTNAAGGIRRTFAPGDLMLIADHLNLMGRNPLVGPNLAPLGPRFPDMTEAYSGRLRQLARETAAAAGIELHEGVYAALLGPSYETPAEIQMLRTLGADAVGMSTAPEVLALRHMGVEVGAISCITNLAAGMSKSKLDHKEVEETARAARGRFTALLAGWIERIGSAAA
ncbi:MAG: purine-nucleoside phosphorylase [Polyangiaceae bacterium]